jgi:RNA polymerase sigma-70 factor (ECF subfamily)
MPPSLKRIDTLYRMTATEPPITQLLAAYSRGDEGAGNALFPVVYAQLRQLARRQLAQARGGTMVPTELVHEAYLKLCDGGLANVTDRRHFFALGARAMRQVLVSRARKRHAIKHDAGRFVTLNENIAETPQAQVDVLALDEALQALADIDERKARAIELRAFGGLSFEEIAQLLDISRATLARDYRGAQAWLYRRLEMSAAGERAP